MGNIYKARIYYSVSGTSGAYREYTLEPTITHNKSIEGTEIDTYEFSFYTTDNVNFGVTEQRGLCRIQLLKKASSTYEVFKNTYLAKKTWDYVSYGTPRLRKYVIQAVGAIYRTQRIVLPNKTISQLFYRQNTSVYTELSKIHNLYGTGLTLDSRLQNILSMDCPEMNFTKSNYFEVLTALFDIGNIIPYMENYNQITYRNKNPEESNVELSSIYFDTIPHEQDISQYCDALDIDVENSIGQSQILETEWIKATADGNQMVTEDNMIWELPMNIYEIKSAKMRVLVSLRETPDFYEEFDITNNIVEESIYSTLKQSSSDLILNRDYKRCNLYYRKGDNKIQGAGWSEKTWISSVSKDTIANIVNFLSNGQLAIASNARRKILIKIEYVPEMDNTRVIVARNEVSDSINRMVSNQNDSYIDGVNFGRKQQENVERLGNEKITGNKKCTGNDYVANLGDWIIEEEKKYIITSISTNFLESCTLISCALSEYRTFVTGYSALKQTKRFFRIDKENTMIRNEANIHNIRVSLNSITSGTIGIFMVSNFNTTGNNNSLHILQPRFGDGRYGDYFLMASQNAVIGKSIVSSVKFKDNNVVGVQIENSGITAYAQKKAKYTDENGEVQRMLWYFGAGWTYRNQTNYDGVKSFPIVSSMGQQIFTDNINVRKDQREVLALTEQFRFRTEDERIILFKRFFELNPLVCQSTTTYHVHEAFQGEEYTEYATSPIGVRNEDAKILIVSGSNIITITGLTDPQTQQMTIGIADTNGKLILGFNNIQNKLIYNQETNTYELKVYIGE